jgi:hypothetical protein
MVNRAGRKRSTASVYADELGITIRRLRMLGGEARLRSMDSQARAVILKLSQYPNSQTVAVGGMAARKMISGVPGVRSQAERVA